MDMESPIRTLVFRSSIIIGLITAVATILYFTPLPDQYPQSCSRTCHELDWPMICRVKMTLERYQTLSRACGECPKNSTDCYNRYCVTGDGEKNGILTANRQFPGPNLRVCQNDLIIVDIVNRVPGRSFSVHWRGQTQRESPHMDGVPMITQCPIPSFTTFQYKFRATQAGTHMWQINTGEELVETLFGGLIVRKPDSHETHRDLYDIEDSSHVIIVHTLSYPINTLANTNTITKLLINGKTKGKGVPPSLFQVNPGRRYRFRLIFGGDGNGCKMRFSIEDHELLVFALDGNPINPVNITSLYLAQGERADFVLRADRPKSSYKITATPDAICKSLDEAGASLVYTEPRQTTGGNTQVISRELSTVSDKECGEEMSGMRVCPGHIQSLTAIPKELLIQEPKHTFYLFYTVRSVSSQTIYNTTFIAMDDTVKIPEVNNVTMMFPSSPLLTQAEDVDSSSLCYEDSKPKSCPGICECVHIFPIKLGAVVELILVNQDTEKPDHVFHLHGYHFYVVGSTILSATFAPEEIRVLDKDKKLVKRNFNNPLYKDTIAVPFNGVSVLRFKADNPGYWLFGEEHSSSWSRGMSVILRVGKESDLPEMPKNFPKCGNWIGPEFFLG